MSEIRPMILTSETSVHCNLCQWLVGRKCGKRILVRTSDIASFGWRVAVSGRIAIRQFLLSDSTRSLSLLRWSNVRVSAHDKTDQVGEAEFARIRRKVG